MKETGKLKGTAKMVNNFIFVSLINLDKVKAAY